MNEIEIIYKARQGNQEAWELLIKKYTPIMFKFAKKAKYCGADFNDAISRANERFVICVNNFDEEKNATFITYLTSTLICILRRSYRPGPFKLPENQNPKFKKDIEVAKNTSTLVKNTPIFYYDPEVNLDTINWSVLTQKEKDIIHSIFYDQKSAKFLAAKYNCSRQTIFNIKKKALRKLKNAFLRH